MNDYWRLIDHIWLNIQKKFEDVAQRENGQTSFFWFTRKANHLPEINMDTNVDDDVRMVVLDANATLDFSRDDAEGISQDALLQTDPECRWYALLAGFARQALRYPFESNKRIGRFHEVAKHSVNLCKRLRLYAKRRHINRQNNPVEAFRQLIKLLENPPHESEPLGGTIRDILHGIWSTATFQRISGGPVFTMKELSKHGLQKLFELETKPDDDITVEALLKQPLPPVTAHRRGSSETRAAAVAVNGKMVAAFESEQLLVGETPSKENGQAETPGLTTEDFYILAVLDAACRESLTYEKIGSASQNLKNAGTIKWVLKSRLIAERVPVLRDAKLVTRPPGTTKKGVCITNAGRNALNEWRKNPA